MANAMQKPKVHRIAVVAAALVLAVTLTPALAGCSPSGPTPDLEAHLITTPDAAPVRPVDSFATEAMSPATLPLTKAQFCARVDELYRIVVDSRKKPVFIDNDPVKPVYDAAIDVMNKYILNAWHTAADGEYRKVHTVHDYLVISVDYDFELYEGYRRGEPVDDAPSFDIDGVFLDKLAVCDGLSRAAAFLCALENIDCVQVTGTYMNVPHAWNRVRVDGTWYNMDITADAANYTIDGTTGYKKQLTHGYFLLSDDTMRKFCPESDSHAAHIFNVQPAIVARHDYDYYATAVMDVGGKLFPMTITDAATLNDLFKTINDIDRVIGKVEIKLAFPGKTNVNDGDLYADELRTAYAQIKNPDFRFSATQNPYFRYPNGVYVCMIYK